MMILGEVGSLLTVFFLFIFFHFHETVFGIVKKTKVLQPLCICSHYRQRDACWSFGCHQLVTSNQISCSEVWSRALEIEISAGPKANGLNGFFFFFFFFFLSSCIFYSCPGYQFLNYQSKFVFGALKLTTWSR